MVLINNKEKLAALRRSPENARKQRESSNRYYDTKGRRKRRQKTQQTHESWLAHRFKYLKNPQIDLNFLLTLYADQNGFCALTGMKMTHRLDDPRSISIDRINSSKGYVTGNVQLVCRWVNLAKQHYPNEIFVELFQELKSGISS